jgi:hypothetical protein
MGIPDICLLCDRSGKTDEKRVKKKKMKLKDGSDCMDT